MNGESQPESSKPQAAGLPRAVVSRSASPWLSAAWLIPGAALVVAAVLVYQGWASRGTLITLEFSEGHGIAVNDPIVFRGVQVGRVDEVGLSADMGKVVIRAELKSDAARLERGGRFWIVRPEVSLARISGLETIIGPRYIAADLDPNAAAASERRTFDSPPVDSSAGPGLDLVLRSEKGGSIAVGSPVTYRELPVGVVTRVALTEDARRVELGVHIAPEFTHLVRENSRFWNVSGIGLDLGLVGGLKLKAESLQSVLAGGVAFATPDRAGKVVESGRRFDMDGEPEKDWLQWAPDLTKP